MRINLRKTFTEINFLTNNDYNQDFTALLNNYPDLYKINTLPQDIYNIYVLSLNDFKNEISLSSIFSDTLFIDILILIKLYLFSIIDS